MMLSADEIRRALEALEALATAQARIADALEQGNEVARAANRIAHNGPRRSY